ncbi:MAG: YihY family inner membrane protein [Betaproteobacteria bacterium]
MSASPLKHTLTHFPWRETARTLRERFREDRLGLSASSLTFTTSIALVPFLTVALAIFTAFPMFAKLQGVVQAWLVESLVPEHIARQVLGYLTQFTRQASRLGAVGFGALALTVLTLVMTIERTLNGIWRVRRGRPLAQRLFIYWGVITLGPLLLATSLAATSQVLPLLAGNRALSGLSAWLLDGLEFVLHAGAMAALFRYMPNTHVRWSHAWSGGVFVAVGLALAKELLAFYLQSVPTYSVVYGAFATVPILLVWIYLAWLIVLMGAVVTAYLPSLLSGHARRASQVGWPFELALACVQQLHRARSDPPHGLSAQALARALNVDLLQLEPLLQALGQIQWIGAVEPQGGDEPTWVLLADPDQTMLAPLAAAVLLEHSPATERFWQGSGWQTMSLRSVL